MVEEVTLEDFTVFLTELQEKLCYLEKDISDLFHFTSDEVFSFLDYE